MTINSAATALSGEPAAPAAATAPAAPDAGSGAPVITQPAATVPPANSDAWFSGIQNPDVRTWAEAKGWKDPLAVAESAYNLEKMIGFDKAGRTIVVPDENSTPEQVAAFHQRLGVPEKADGYKLPVPEGTAPEFANTAATWFHEAGVPAAAAEKVATKWNEYLKTGEEATHRQFAAQSERDFGELKVEWGNAFAAKQELAQRAATTFLPANSPEERQNMLSALERVTGTKKMMEFFANIGEGLGEHKLHQGGGNGIMTPAQANQRIAELKSNPEWSNKYLSGDKASAKELTDLIAAANPEG